QASPQRLALRTVDDVFAQGLPETLGDATDNLPFDQAWVDDTATVVDSNVAPDGDLSRLSAHLYDHGMRTKGERGSREGVGATDNQTAFWRDGVGAGRSPSLHRAMCPAGGSRHKLGEGRLLLRRLAIGGGPG